MASPTDHEINGNPSALSFDRAVDELRRGRAVHVTDGASGLVFAAIETVQQPLFERMMHRSIEGAAAKIGLIQQWGNMPAMLKDDKLIFLIQTS